MATSNPASNREVITVSELNRDARQLLETSFPFLYVEGEISNLAQPSSGHWYFTLKDDRAQVRCAMFRNRNHMVRFKPRNGMQIIVRGRISLYENRGEFQLIAEFLEEAGDGALRRAFEKLKNALQAEGLFSEDRKRPVPSLPNHIAIITSPTGAAIRDVLTIMGRRFPGIHATVIPVQVQGEESVRQIVDALELANRYAADPFDLILLTRGGGSLEDLWSFNTEPVARAVAVSRLPVVCAVGHESDVSIADFVADLRAPTPSAAAELITPDRETWLEAVGQVGRRLVQATLAGLSRHQQEISHLSRRLRHPSNRLDELAQRLDDLKKRLVIQGRGQLTGYRFGELERRLEAATSRRISNLENRVRSLRLRSPETIITANRTRLNNLNEKLQKAVSYSLTGKQTKLIAVTEKLDALSPLSTLKRGYAIVEKDEHVVVDAGELSPGDRITGRLMKGTFEADVTRSEDS